MAGVNKSVSSGASDEFAVGGGGGGGGEGGGGDGDAGGCSSTGFGRLSGVDLIFGQPDRYIGSVHNRSQKAWVCGGASDLAMVWRKVNYIPGLLQMFDEILLNAAENKLADPTMSSIEVDFDMEVGSIRIHNDGLGLPVEKRKGVYVADTMFSELGASCKLHEGRSGLGAKLVNIFSTKFIVETSDGKRKYRQTFSDHMSRKTLPEVTKCSKKGTTITFFPDLSLLGITSLCHVDLSLMRRRVVDVAGTLGPSVHVHMNSHAIPTMSFLQYVECYIGADPTSKLKYPRVYEHMNNDWDVCVTLSQGRFQHVTFVNHIATLKGGSHVDFLIQQIAERVVVLLKMNHNFRDIEPGTIKHCLWIFVNALVKSPSFKSHKRDYLTTIPANFGSECRLSEEFIAKVSDMIIIKKRLSLADTKVSEDASDGKKILKISKLEDANDAGGKHSKECTLILTEGDSAKTFAVAGLSVVGRDRYGVYPLRGKPMNVRETPLPKIARNVEIQNIMEIMGLEFGKHYDSVRGLRYGKIWIMADQDHDGSHIKGLLINFFHAHWPSLLKLKSFLFHFITPIIKAINKKDQSVVPFYSMGEYEKWSESVGTKTSHWTIKYYKGLGTSTSEEAIEYFNDIANHIKEFIWDDKEDDEHIVLAFSKEKIQERKKWMNSQNKVHDQNSRHGTFSHFVDTELADFSRENLRRSIPSIVDGLKPGQRKVLFGCFKKKLVKEHTVSTFSGYVMSNTAYHHGKESIEDTIVGMARNHLGSNNINLLQPGGQFGTRIMGGKDGSTAKYIYTSLSEITRVIFPKEDDIILNFLREDGQSVEPTWFAPIIPLVLVNGCYGIGTGWSTFVPNYNPVEIVDNLKRLMKNKTPIPMNPWYRGFKGSIKHIKDTTTYTTTGTYELIGDTMIRITELPIGCWTEKYKQFLQSMLDVRTENKEMTKRKKGNKIKFEEIIYGGDERNIDFLVRMTEESMFLAKKRGLEKTFKLTTTLSTGNMHLYNAQGELSKYTTPEEILCDFYNLRIKLYKTRKDKQQTKLESEIRILNNKIRFIRCFNSGELISKLGKEMLVSLKEKGFDPCENERDPYGTTEELEQDDQSKESSTEYEHQYAYLLKMHLDELQEVNAKHLSELKEKMEIELDYIRRSTPEELWSRDLKNFVENLSIFNAQPQPERKSLSEAAAMQQQDATTSKSLKAKGLLVDDDGAKKVRTKKSPIHKDKTQEQELKRKIFFR